MWWGLTVLVLWLPMPLLQGIAAGGELPQPVCISDASVATEVALPAEVVAVLEQTSLAWGPDAQMQAMATLETVDNARYGL